MYQGSPSGVSVGLTHSSGGPCAGSVCLHGGVPIWGECGSGPLFMGELCKVSVGGFCAWTLWVYQGSPSGVSVGLTHSS